MDDLSDIKDSIKEIETEKEKEYFFSNEGYLGCLFSRGSGIIQLGTTHL
jgi:saccharopine dehydrogenase-like NADP-dependent oxidoreductase